MGSYMENQKVSRPVTKVTRAFFTDMENEFPWAQSVNLPPGAAATLFLEIAQSRAE